MAEEWEIVIRDPAAMEDISIARLNAKQLARFARFIPLDLQSEFTPEYMLPAIMRRVPDPEEAAKRAEERRELDRLSAEAGRKIERELKEQAHA